MSSTTKGIVTVLIVAGVGYLAYKQFFQDKKAFYAKKLADAGKTSNETVAKKFEEGFLKAWYKGLKDKSETFSYNGKSYKTQGGVAA
jgi:uncharacterized protein YxeA